MNSVFDIIPNNFFNLLSSNSNYKNNAVVLKFIYEQYENEISYRINRNFIRDELAYFIGDNLEEFTADSDGQSKSYRDIASDYLRRFASKDVGWLEEELDDSTFDKYIILTEQGLLLADLLVRLEQPEREELSSYIFNIYNTLMNKEQWQSDPYVGALKNVYINSKALSKSLKKMSTYIRKVIEKVMIEISYESLTENIIAYCDGNFIKEYARLINPQNNIFVYRGRIISMLEELQRDEETYELIIIGCVAEEDLEEWEAIEKVDLMFDSIKKFLKEDYAKLISDITNKLQTYIKMAHGRLRYLKNHEVDMRGNVERTLKYLLSITECTGLKEFIAEEMNELIRLNQNKYIDLKSIRMPSSRKSVREKTVTLVDNLTADDLIRLKNEFENAAKNPYSKQITKEYIKALMGTKHVITSGEIPLNKKEDLLMILSSVAYADGNGYKIEIDDGFVEFESLVLRAFKLWEE